MQEGEDPVQDGKDPTQEGKDPVQDGKDPIQEGEDPIQEGEDPIQEGEDPVHCTTRWEGSYTRRGGLSGLAVGCGLRVMISTGGKRSLVPLIRIMPAQ